MPSVFHNTIYSFHPPVSLTPSLLSFREKPLALYLFTESAENKKHVSTFTSSGALVVNDTVLHAGGE